MAEFMTTYALEQVVADPYKRVRYSPGLVLGVDEFVQDQVFFMEGDRHHARSLHGYGTVSGLRVFERPNDAGAVEIVVTSGVAITPAGEVVRVPYNQCVGVNAWLSKYQDAVREALPDPLTGDDPLDLYVVLCYRECESDKVPVPGGPCRSQDDSMAYSRVGANYDLKLTFAPPNQLEEDTVRSFGDLLRAIAITDDAPAVVEDDLLDLVRTLIPPEERPLPDGTLPPPFTLPGGPLNIPPADAPRLLREVYQVWITEVRPHLLYRGSSADLGPDVSHCVLLAHLTLRISGVLQLVAAVPIDVDTSERPLLIHTRALQEALHELQSSSVDAGLPGVAGGDLSGTYPDPTVIGLQGRGVNAASPNPDDVLLWNGVEWVPAAVPVDLTPFYLLDGSRALTGDMDAGNHRLTNLAPAINPADAVRLDQIIPPGSGVGGDLTGSLPNPTIANLQGQPVNAAAPNPDDVLTWDGSEWVPAAAQTGPPEVPVVLTLPLATITRLDARLYEVWFNIDSPDNEPRVELFEPDGPLTVFQETNQPNSFLRRIGIEAVNEVTRNVFNVQLRSESTYLRFRFDLRNLTLDGGGSLLEFSESRRIRFVGQNARRIVVKYVRGPIGGD